MPWVNFLFVMGHLFVNHVDEQMHPDFNTNNIGITGSQMVLCMKLSSFGWNVWDGTRPESELSDFQKDRRITDHPPLTEFLAYVFFFPCILTGPSCDFAEFRRWLDLSMFDELDKKVAVDGTIKRRRRRIPRSGRAATRKLVAGVLWIVLWTQTANWISLEYAQSEAFTREMNFIVRAVYLYVLGFTYRLKYYGAWYIAEGACILSGLGFNGRAENGKLKWNRVQNVDPLTFEFGQSTHVLLSAWNMNTNKWLKNYVYLRVTPKGRKPGFRSTLATFVTSAVWHGTRPGYYLTFVNGSFLQSLGRVFRRYIRPIFLEADGVTPTQNKVYYDVACFVVVQLSFGYIVQPFIILDLRPSLSLWASVYFYVNVVMAACVLVFFGPPKRAAVAWLRQYHPKQATPTDKVKERVKRLKDLRRELEDLQQFEQTLGVPQPDMEHMDDELREAKEDLQQIRSELSELLRDGVEAASAPDDKSKAD